MNVKKVIICFGAILLLLSSMCFAQIRTEGDSFSGVAGTISETKGLWFPLVPEAVGIDLYKEKAGYSIGFNVWGSEKWVFFANKNAQIKIDGEIIPLKIIKVDKDYDDGCYTDALFDVDSAMVERLKNAEKISFKVTLESYPAIIWEVPQNVLDEWRKML